MTLVTEIKAENDANNALPEQVDVLIVGGGIAGLASAYALARAHPSLHILVAEQASEICAVTTAAAGGGFRCWWPTSPVLGRLAHRSISLLRDEIKTVKTPESLSFSDIGYLMLSAQKEKVQDYLHKAAQASAHGAGPVRLNGQPWCPSDDSGNVKVQDDLALSHFDLEAYMQQNDGVDVLSHPVLIKRVLEAHSATPNASIAGDDAETRIGDAAAVLHVRNAGHLDPVALGQHILARASAYGHVQATTNVELVDVKDEYVYEGNAETRRIRGARLRNTLTGTEHHIRTRIVVLAVGPYLRALGLRLGVQFAVVNEPHTRIVYDDPLRAGPSGKQSWMFWSDPVTVPGPAGTQITLPPNAHARLWRKAGDTKTDQSCRQFSGVWTYRREHHDIALDDVCNASKLCNPVVPPQVPKDYALRVLQGLQPLFPKLEAYLPPLDTTKHVSSAELKCAHKAVSGYYCKTSNNHPMIGEIQQNAQGQSMRGLWVCGALSGHGIMISLGCGELLAKRLEHSGQLQSTKACGTAVGIDDDEDDGAQFSVRLGDFLEDAAAATDQM